MLLSEAIQVRINYLLEKKECQHYGIYTKVLVSQNLQSMPYFLLKKIPCLDYLLFYTSAKV